MNNIKVTDEDLNLINQHTRSNLAADDIYTFTIRLCDNRIDKDNERFSIAALNKLSQLYIGKTGYLSNHNETARIYKCFVVTDYNSLVEDGEPYTYLEANAYIRKIDFYQKLIAELEEGNRKEISVGCAVSTLRCSICNQDVKRSQCIHVKGNTYNGSKCHYILENPTDAYEWSFVHKPKPAIPKKVKVRIRKRVIL